MILFKILTDSLEVVNGTLTKVFPIEEDIYYMAHQELEKPHLFKQLLVHATLTFAT